MKFCFSMGNSNQFKRPSLLLCAIIFLSIGSFAQSLNESQFTSMPVHVTYSCMLQEDTVYNFYINRIFPIQTGRLIEAVTYDIPLMQVRAYIVFPHRVAWYRCSIIKIGKTLPLRVLKYTEDYSQTPFEGYGIVNILLGEKNLRIEERGLFSYLFTSPDIQKHPSSVCKYDHRKAKFEQYKDGLTNIVNSFINILSYGDSITKLSDFADTNKLKHSFKERGFFYFNYKGYEDFQQRIPSKESPKFDWKGVQGINPNDFVGIAQKISYLDGYARQNSIDETVNITSIQLLYAEGQIYTFRVIWRFPNEEQSSSSAIISAKYSYGKWTITGLKARSFREQRREFLQSTKL